MSKRSRSMGDLSADWSEFLSLLISHEVAFVVVGGHAVAVHAQPRYTQDLDLFVDTSELNAGKLHDCLVEFGFGEVAPDLALLRTPGKIFMLGRLPNRIDLLTAIDGVSFSEARRSAVFVETSVGRLPFISRELLVRNKEASGRPKDLADLALLRATAVVGGVDDGDAGPAGGGSGRKPAKRRGAPKKSRR